MDGSHGVWTCLCFVSSWSQRFWLLVVWVQELLGVMLLKALETIGKTEGSVCVLTEMFLLCGHSEDITPFF